MSPHAKAQQAAYRKIEQRIALLRVLLRANVVTAHTIKCESVSHTIDEMLFFKVFASTHTDEQIVTAFKDYYALINNKFYNS